ncbi:hypothetical protein BR93DRAFT_123937 [Coniochaeta sp. PMI_546]|nr:hypothetical protein BR93DRAFT_123937 [Coniochaeta sp. PMI_546]
MPVDVAAIPAGFRIGPAPAAPGLHRKPPELVQVRPAQREQHRAALRHNRQQQVPLQPPVQPGQPAAEGLAQRLNRRNLVVNDVAEALPPKVAVRAQQAPAHVLKAQYKQPMQVMAKAALPAGAGDQMQRQRAALRHPAQNRDEHVRKLRVLEERNKAALEEMKRRQREVEERNRQRLEEMNRHRQVAQNARRAAKDAYGGNAKNQVPEQAADPRLPRRRERYGQHAAGAVFQALEGRIQAMQAQMQAVVANNIRPPVAGNAVVPPVPQQLRNVPRPIRVQRHYRHQHAPPPVLAYGNRLTENGQQGADGGMLGSPARL